MLIVVELNLLLVRVVILRVVHHGNHVFGTLLIQIIEHLVMFGDGDEIVIDTYGLTTDDTEHRCVVNDKVVGDHGVYECDGKQDGKIDENVIINII